MSGKNDNNLPSQNNMSDNGSYNGFYQNGNATERIYEDTAKDLEQLFYMVWHHKWLVAGSIFVCMALAYIAASSMTPIYRSYGTMLISQPENRYSYAGSGLADLLSTTYGIGQGTTIANELFILESWHLSHALADTLLEIQTTGNGKKLPILYKQYPTDSTTASIEKVTGRLQKKLESERVSDKVDIIKISYNSPSAVGAAQVVNLAMATYREFSTRQNRRSAAAAVKFLENERQRIKENLRQAEIRLQAFRADENIVQVSAQTQELIERMADLETKKQTAKVNQVAVNSAIQQFKKRLNKIKPGLAAQFINDIGPEMKRLQFSLAELKTQKSQLLYNYPNIKTMEGGPSRELKNLNDEIAYYEKQIRQLTQKMIESSEKAGFLAVIGKNIGKNISSIKQRLIELQVQKQQYKAQIKTINATLANMEQYFQNLPGNMTSLARLSRQVQINEQLFLTISQQYAETSLWQQTQFSSGRVIDPARIMEAPIKPSTRLYLLVGLMIGMVLSIGFIFGKEAFDNSINSVEKLKDMDVPLLALIPDMNSYIKKVHSNSSNVKLQDYNISTQLITAHDTNSPISESFRRLESNIIHSNPDSDLKTIMVTSTTKGEGKTTVISNLGVILAESNQKVVLVETDLRRPHIHNMFGMESSPGLMNLLFENTAMEQAIHSTPVPNLHLLPSGYMPPNQAAVMKSSAFASAVTELKNHFDFVLLDTAPYGIISDASSLLRLSDGVIVAAKFDVTLEAQLKNTLEELSKIKANVIGTVLTHFDYTKSTDYGYGTGYYRYKYEDYENYADMKL